MINLADGEKIVGYEYLDKYTGYVTSVEKHPGDAIGAWAVAYVQSADGTIRTVTIAGDPPKGLGQ